MTTPKDIKLALAHHRELNDGDRYWARFEAIQHSDEIRTVRLDIGLKLFGEEKKIATRHYFLDRFNQVNWYEAVHP